MNMFCMMFDFENFESLSDDDLSSGLWCFVILSILSGHPNEVEDRAPYHKSPAAEGDIIDIQKLPFAFRQQGIDCHYIKDQRMMFTTSKIREWLSQDQGVIVTSEISEQLMLTLNKAEE